MHTKRSNKVPQWNCLYAVMILTSTLIGQAVCSDSSNNYNTDAYASGQRKVPPSGSGSGTLEKRSSYAVLSAAMSDTVNSEFGSKYSRDAGIRRQSSVRSFCKIMLQRWRFRFSRLSKQVVTFEMPLSVKPSHLLRSTTRHVGVTALAMCVFINYSNITNKHISSSFRVNRTARRRRERRRRNQTHRPIHKSPQVG